MATITGVSSISGQQIIATASFSAGYAARAYSASTASWSHSAERDSQKNIITATYQKTADMTAYQPAGDYLTTGDSANFYTTANESGFISEVPATYLQNTDLTIADNKVTEISGVPLAGGVTGDYELSAGSGISIEDFPEQQKTVISVTGGTVPEGTMVQSGLEYDANNKITGYSGSAIAGEATIYTDTATMTGQGTVSEPFGVKSTDLFVQEPLYTGTSGDSAYIGFDSDIAGISGPLLNTKTFAGYWNGSAVYQKMIIGEFTTNVATDVHDVDADYSASTRKWIDPSQSFIHYGSSANVLPTTWVLGATNRLGGISLLSNIIRARSNDTANTQCTAFVVVKWVENN